MKYKNFVNILKKFNCKKDDIVLIHSDVSLLNGISWIEKCKNLESLIESYFSKNSTILFPAFTYSFCKTGIFNSKKSPSEVGIFDEYIRNKTGFNRTDHPIFSFSCKGKHEEIFLNNSNSSTGNGSVFEKLYVLDAKILFLGCRFINSNTFLHFIEQKNTIPYRYSKTFFPRNKMKYSNYEYYVRAKEKYFFYKYGKSTKIEKDLIAKKILKRTFVDKFEISVCSTRDIFNFVSKKIKNDPFYILDKKPEAI